METVVRYRAHAAALRAEANELNLRKARAVKIAAAEKWEVLAREIETVIGPSGESFIEEWIR